MQRPRLFALALLAAAGLSAALAASASAFPSRTNPCSACHDGPNVPVTTTLSSVSGTTATYGVSAPTADTIAVFDGTTKVATINGASGSFSVATGKTYTVFAVTGPGTSDGIGSTTVSPTAPAPVDSTAPVTTSNAVANYVSSATITLTATDAGSGLAATYYRLDGGAQTTGTSVTTSALGTHTLVFWSVDKAGNVETARTVNFTVTAPAPVDVTAPVTTSNAVASYVSMAAITLSATDSGSGVAATYYRLDGGAQTAGTNVVTSALGAHTLEFWSVDAAGNIETPRTVNFTVTAPAPVDLTAPVTTSDAVPAYVTSAAIRLTATDAGSGVATTYYRLDGGAQTAGTNVVTSVLGAHTLEFWSVDAAGNIETPRSVNFTVSAAEEPPGGEVATSTVTIQAKVRGERRVRTIDLRGLLSPAGGGELISLYVMKPGSSEWELVSTLPVSRASDDEDDEERDEEDARREEDERRAGEWNVRYTAALRGVYRFQARFAGDTDSAASQSRVVKVTVRLKHRD